MTTERLSARLVLGIRAALALLFGLAGTFMVVLAAFAPRTTTVLIVQLFASYALLDELLSVLTGARAASRVVPRSFMVLEGLVSIGTGGRHSSSSAATWSAKVGRKRGVGLRGHDEDGQQPLLSKRSFWGGLEG
jgi:hypothetical protein